MILISMSKTVLSLWKEKAVNKYLFNNTGFDFAWINDGKYMLLFLKMELLVLEIKKMEIKMKQWLSLMKKIKK